MLLGLDCGSTAIKAVLFSADGSTLATGTRRTEPLQPAPNRVEHDMDRLWQLACAAIAEALAAAPPDAGTVEAIGVTGHGDGLYLCDRAGRPLGRGIQSVDSRARDITAAWDASGVLDSVVAITAQRPYPYAASTLLAWIARHQPERFAAIGHVMFCKDWMRYRLTGRAVTDPTDASTAFTEAQRQRYSDDLLSRLGLEAVRPALPPILPSSEVIGRVSAAAAAETGLVEGTAVAGGMHDVTASAVGLGNLQPGVLSITAGTFSINETLSDHLVVDPRWTARAGLRPGQWMNMSISPASSNNADWFLRQAYGAEWEAAALGGPSVWDMVEADLSRPAAEDAPLFHPFLYGSPYDGPASASFFGLRSWHGRADMLRAVVEGAVFNHRFHAEALRSAFPVSRAGITGGGTSRERPARLFADALGLPVEVPEVAEVGALGAALVAGVGVGIYASLDDAVRRACRVAARYAPNEARKALLDERFARYVALAEAVPPVLVGQPFSGDLVAGLRRMTASQTRRSATLRHFEAAPRLSVLIVGGGINGAGTFRDLALQGVDCLIVDKGDWCAGTSAAPSRLIHGGLKYLETGEFRLVAESTRERNLLLRNAPHLVKALPTVVPIHSTFGGVVPSIRRFFGRKAKLADRGLLIVELGLALYDWLGRKHRVMPRHSVSLRSGTRRRFPAMARTVLATSTYYDARVTQAERLCYELVADGEAAHEGAHALNYVAVTGAAGGRVTLTDQVTGETMTVEPKILVNAAGPWIDRVNRAMGLNKTMIGGTKGSHLVVDNSELVRQLDGHMIYFGSPDGRICLVYPFFGKALIGSTDIKADDPDAVVCDDGEADYMLGMVRQVFPGLPLTRDQIVYRYAGIRPLPAAEVDDPGEISRDHSVGRDTLPGSDIPILSLVGGKWTTFRAFAAEVTGEVLAGLGQARRNETTFVPIGGGRDFPEAGEARRAWIARVSREHAVAPARVEVWLDRYGTSAEAILQACEGGGEDELSSLPGYGARELGTVIEREQVVALTDLVFRRLPIAVSGQLSPEALADIADIAARTLQWSDDERERQVESLRRVARERHGIDIGGRAGSRIAVGGPGAFSS